MKPINRLCSTSSVLMVGLIAFLVNKIMETKRNMVLQVPVCMQLLNPPPPMPINGFANYSGSNWQKFE